MKQFAVLLIWLTFVVFQTKAQSTDAAEFFWCDGDDGTYTFHLAVNQGDTTLLDATTQLYDLQDCGEIVAGRSRATRSFRLEGELPDQLSALEGVTSVLQSGDTLFLAPFSLPGLSLINFNLPEVVAENLFYPTAVFSKDVGDRWTLERREVRVPFPDTLAPDNALVTFPDSVDVVFDAFGERHEQLANDNLNLGPYEQFRLALTVFLRMEVQPIIGQPITLFVPLLEEYEIRTEWAPNHVGLTRLDAPEYSLEINWEEIGGPAIPGATIPSIQLDLQQLVASSIHEERLLIPQEITVNAYPNPFNPRTNFAIELNQSATVTLEIYDLQGRLISTLLENQTMTSGTHQVKFQMQHGASQIYLYRLQSEMRNGDVSTKSGTITFLK